MRAQIIVLAGPSGAGKSRLAERTGLPVLRLDDFYRDGSETDLPRIATGANAGLVDWDAPASWSRERALEAIRSLCRTGEADVPVYSIPRSATVGSQHLSLGADRYFVAEGVFAAEVVASCADEGLLACALCVRQHPLVTFWRRLTRDLKERRKPPLVLVRRGLALLRGQRRVVQTAAAKGCRPVTPDEALPRIQRLVRAADPASPAGATGLRT